MQIDCISFGQFQFQRFLSLFQPEWQKAYGNRGDIDFHKISDGLNDSEALKKAEQLFSEAEKHAAKASALQFSLTAILFYLFNCRKSFFTLFRLMYRIGIARRHRLNLERILMKIQIIFQMV